MAKAKKNEKPEEIADPVAKANENLGKMIYEAYTSNQFGRAYKAEIDKMVFHSFLLRNLPDICKDEKNAGGKSVVVVRGEDVMYLRLSKRAIYQLSLRARVKESTIQSMLEADFYNHQKDDKFYENELKRAVSNIVMSTKASAADLVKDGKVRVVVANPITKKMLMQKLNDIGAVGDYSFNRDIVSMSVADFLQVLDVDESDVRKSLLETAKDNYGEKSEEYEKSSEKINNAEKIFQYLKSTGDFALKDLIGKVNSGLVELGKMYAQKYLPGLGM